MKTNKLKTALRAVVYLLIFSVLFTLLNLFLLPKRSGTGENSQVAGFYKEPSNTIDVLGLGSCNLYSSFSPVVLYEKTGITCYNFCCPDEELSTSYYFLKEALKTQNIKVVMVESLFFTAENTAKREYYNRLAVDYMPISINKLEFIADLTESEYEIMSQYDSTAPDKLLTYAGYLFPALRFHSRNDFGRNDIESLFTPGEYSPLKGGVPQYNYTRNDGNFFNIVFNGDKLCETCLKYMPMIKQLCDENNIELIVLKSPNYLRWGRDDTHTKLVRDYCEQLGIPFVDFHLPENNNFEIWDYGDHTGRLNVYGMRKFSETVGRYLTEKMGLASTELSEENKAQWDLCVEEYYSRSAKRNCDIYQGHIAQLKSIDGAMQVRWNVCDDCDSFAVYRCESSSGSFTLLTDNAVGETYEDTDVVSGNGYSYYVVPNGGSLAGVQSPTEYAVYLDMPDGFTAVNDYGKIRLSWNAVADADKYILQRRAGNGFAFEDLAEVSGTSFVDDTAENGCVYYYRLIAEHTQDDKEYFSMSEIVYELPRKIPEITEICFDDDAVVFSWIPLSNLNEIAIFRRTADNDSFVQIAVISGNETSFRDDSVQSGAEYFYKIAAMDSYLDFSYMSEYSNTVGIKTIK